eukprot:CAMPEP_0194141900 /NCGR_PEP_ID=MMETSP0152-20130528/11256_1 /TAXON_ID=1049557 /ORGANISM="Thalassiothrix antarctica, Strain L6-D1" /LENGTH=61 /DNA_ID=CAMNT_0038840675 /DNA_START=376 /DNA_END=558 /DNA_ORIENTATION=+
MTPKEALAEAKLQEVKDRKYLKEAKRKKEENFSQVNVMIPAFEYSSETVAGGPHFRHRSEG